jgi:hypothetical protein
MSRGPGIMQREILRRAQARRNAFTVKEMAAKLFAEIDDTRLGAVRRAMRGLEAMGYLSRDDQGRYRHTSKRRPRRREWMTPVELVQIGFDEADKILADGNHYLGPAGWKRGYVLTTPTRDALAIFAPPVAAHFNQVLEMPLELTRLWRSDDCPFVLSQFLSACSLTPIPLRVILTAARTMVASTSHRDGRSSARRIAPAIGLMSRVRASRCRSVIAGSRPSRYPGLRHSGRRGSSSRVSAKICSCFRCRWQSLRYLTGSVARGSGTTVRLDWNTPERTARLWLRAGLRQHSRIQPDW